MHSDVFCHNAHNRAMHPDCQDYVRTGVADFHYAILSDGCSSAPDSDVGARLMVLAAENHLKSSSEISVDAIMETAKTYQSTLQVDQSCLSATLLAAWHDQDMFHASIHGDGFVIARKTTGELHVLGTEFTSNAPLYPIYLADERLYQQYLNEFGDFEHRALRSDMIITKDDVTVEQKSFSVDEHHGWRYSFSMDEYDLVAVASDGLTSFRENDSHVPLSTTVRSIFDFKGYAGQFVVRRCVRLFNSFHKIGRINTDDFSIAVITTCH